MPLEEISANIPRRTDSSRKSGHNESTSSLPAPPSAIQSMLKTTTELGDLGQFGSRPSRLPRSGSRLQSTRVRSGSYDTSFASALRHDRSPFHRPDRHHGPRPALSASTLSARYTSRSNLSSYAPSQHPRRRRQHGPPPNSPHPSIYTHRSLVTLRSQQDVHSVRSMSPGAPPPWMRRPPRRTASPAFTDSRSMHTPQPGFSRAPSAGTVASSPAHSYRQPPYPFDMNSSYGSLHRMPPLPHPAGRAGFVPSFAPPMRYQTPDMSSRNATLGTPGNTTSLADIPQSPSGSTAPAYYDYSESFTEENCFSPDRGNDGQQLPLNMDQTIWEGVPMPAFRDAQTPFGIREGSKFYPSELPTKHNRRTSEQSRPRSGKSDRRQGQKPGSRHSVKRPFPENVPQRSSSIDATLDEKKSVDKFDIRRTRSEDSGAGDVTRQDHRRLSTIARRSGTSSPSTAFFAGPSRSDRDLALLAARVHSPLPGTASKIPRPQPRPDKIVRRKDVQDDLSAQPVAGGTATQTPKWQIPDFKFRPMSFMSDSPVNGKRPRTSETPSSRFPLEIHSPMPKRPTSSQSRKRFRKILDVELADQQTPNRVIVKQPSCAKEPGLNMVEESPVKQLIDIQHDGGPVSPVSQTHSLEGPPYNFADDRTARISGVTSHDKSTVESLLDKHIECLGLQNDSVEQDSATNRLETQDAFVDRKENATETSTTIRLTDLLHNVHIMERGRPTTSASQQYSSLATLDRYALKPRRLFASMDARVPGSIQEQLLPISSTSLLSENHRPSYGWQTLPSTSALSNSIAGLPTLTSGNLGDVDTSETTPKLRVKRRSLLSTSASELSILSTLSSGGFDPAKTCGLHKRSKSEIIARQASHRRRRIRIRLKMKTRSRTTGDLSNREFTGDTPLGAVSHARDERVSNEKSPVTGYAELSGDSVQPSYSNLGNRLSKAPAIPNRWSSIIASMPLPGKKSHEVHRKPSIRSHRSHRSNTSIVEPVNATRSARPIHRMGSVPQLGPPDLGPPLTSSELNLSIPYAEVPSTIRPTLRETKSFFSDNSSIQRVRGNLRQKLHLHSLRNMLPASPLASLTPPRKPNTVTLSHSCQMKGRVSVEGKIDVPSDTVPMTDYAYRRRKVVEKFKDWWKRQCLQKVVHNRKVKRERKIPGTVVWSSGMP